MSEQGQAKLAVTAEALLSIRNMGGLTVSADGETIIFTVDEVNFEKSRRVPHLFCAEFRRGRAFQLTWSESGEHSPLFAPDGRSVAFLSSRGQNFDDPDDALSEQVWVLPQNGEAKKITDITDSVTMFRWHPDGRLLYLAPEAKPAAIKAIEDKIDDQKRDLSIEDAEKQRQQIWACDSEGGDKTLLYAGDYGVSHFEVSPDGNWIVYSTNYTGEGRDEHKHDLWLLNLETHETRRLLERHNSGWLMSFSPDSQSLAFIGGLNPDYSFSHHSLFLMPLEGGEPVNLTEGFDLEVDGFEWSLSDGMVYLRGAQGMYTRLFKLNPKTRHLTCLTPENVNVIEHMPGKRGVALLINDRTEPPELYSLRTNGKKLKLTTLNADFTKKYRQAKQEIVRWQSDEWEIEGLLVYPLDYEPGKRYPAILAVHGGPAGRATDVIRSYTMPHLFAAHGYAVLLPNYRGSSGYSEAFVTANVGDLGGGDYRDILKGADWLVENGIADPERLGIMGGSYGGYMTNWAISQTDRFKAAISAFGIFNLVTDYSNSSYPRWEREYLGAYYWDNLPLYLERSPARYVQNIKTPVLIEHGEEDDNTLLTNSKEMYQALRDKGDTPVEFLRFPREGHGNGEPNHRLEEARRWLEWFDRYLKQEKALSRRIGDLIKANDWELRIIGAEPMEFGKERDENRPYLRVEFALTHREGKREDFSFALSEVKLSDEAGRVYRPIGIPVTLYDTPVLIEGRGLRLHVAADTDSGVVAAPIAALFDLPRKGGSFLLHVRDFPTVTVFVNPLKRQRKPKPSKPASDTLPPKPQPTQKRR